MRYFIEIAYSGKNYFGWQRQPNQISIQQVLEESMSTILRKEIKLVGAGRTDAGVHAKQLMAHFDIDLIENEEKFIFKINSFLPQDIAIKRLIKVQHDAHARFDAMERTYQYVINTWKNPFLTDFAHQIFKSPDIELMNQAANSLLNHENFQCFSRSKTDVKTYNCKVKEAYWKDVDDTLIFTITADRFLRNMVRAVVGTLLEVGFGKKSLEDFMRVLNSRRREEAGASAPAHALYLTKIVYPEKIFLNSKSRKNFEMENEDRK